MTVQDGATLMLSGTSASGVGTLNLGASDGSSSGSVSVSDSLSVQGVVDPGSESVSGGLNWTDGTISGPGTVTLAAPVNSNIEPATATDNIVLDGTDLINKGWLSAYCSTTNDTANSMTLIQGEDGATLDNQGGSLWFDVPNGSSAPYGCEFRQVSGAPSTLENNGTIWWSGDDDYDTVNVGWVFDNSQTDSDVNNAIIDAYGGQTEPACSVDPGPLCGQTFPISGHWMGATVDMMSGGAYSITSDLADFGAQNGSEAWVGVRPAPGSSGGASSTYTSFLAGNTTAPSLTITGGQWQYGGIDADGPLTLGQAGQATTVGAVWSDNGETIDVDGTVNAYSYDSGGGTIDYGASGDELNVYGTTGLSGTEAINGGGSVDFEGPVDLSGNATIANTSGEVVLQGQVSGTGNLTVTSSGAFYEQGGIDIAGNLAVNSGSGDMQLSGAVTADDVNLTTSGSIDLDAEISASTLEAQAGDAGMDVEAGLNNESSVSLTSPGDIDIQPNGWMNAGTLTLAGGGTTTSETGWIGVNTLIADGEIVDNEGVLGIYGELLAEDGAQIINDNMIQADNTAFVEGTGGFASTFVNTNSGELGDWNNPSTPDNTISIPYSGGGTVSNAYIINDSGSNQYGGNNPAAPDMVATACDQATDCGNGDWSTSETDLSVAGLGGPLALTRQYSSRLAMAESSPGMFGYGWITPFEQRLYVDPASGAATVQTTTGSSAVFNLVNGAYQPDAGIYATLTATTSPDTCSSNSNSAYTYVQPDQTTTCFNAAGYPLSVTNRQNQTTTYTYNTEGQLTQVTAPTSNGAGRSISFTYITGGPGTGLVGTATDPAGLVMTYQYDVNDNLTSVTESSGPSPNNGSSHTAWTYYYDQDGGNPANDLTDLHELTSLFNAGGNATTISYEGGYVTGVQQPGKGAEIWTYEVLGSPSDNTGGETSQTSPAGNVTTYTYNSQDEPTNITYADGSTENMGYDSNGDLTSEQDGNGGWTYYWYDQYGNQNKEEDPDGQYTYWNYDAQRDLLSEELPSGETTTYNSYDGGGEPASVTVSNPDVSGTPSETTSMTYWPDEQLETKTAPDGGETQYTYDSYGDPATVTGPATSSFPSGTETTYGYDADGRQVCETTPRVTALGQQCVNGQAAPANAQVNTYDLLGDLTSSTTPDGGVTSYTYEPDQQVASETAPSSNVSNVTSYSYFPNGQLESTTTGTGSSATTQSETYDNDDNLATQTNGDGKTYDYVYNDMDQLWTSTPPAGSSQTTTYTYDGDGNVHTITYPAVSGASEVTTYSYNGENKVSGIGYSDGETSVADQYTPDGQLATMSDASGHSTYLYDGLDRLTNVCVDATAFITSASQCSGDSGRPVSYGYNADNDQTSIGYPNGDSVSQNFNAADQMTSVEDWDSNTTGFGYDADSDLLTTTFPSASNETDTYSYANNYDDALMGVTMKTGSTTDASLSYTRYPDDVIETEGQTGLPGPASDSYNYTEQQELASDTVGSSASNYTYDAARNMTELNGDGTNSLAYSTNGDSELTSDPAGAFAYNPLGERTSFTPTGGTATTYSYDADQNLTQVATPSATVGYVYNGSGQLMSSTKGSTTTDFTWDDTASTPRLLQAGSEYYIYGPDGEPIEQINGSTVQYLHQDQIGSTRLITNSSGTVGGSYTYSPYGDVTSYTAGTGSDTTLLGYAGQYTDPTTHLEYNQARWYDPNTGQFMVIDPKVATTWQPYGYANDNPLSDTDPSGNGATGLGGCGSRSVNQCNTMRRNYCSAHPRGAVPGSGVSCATAYGPGDISLNDVVHAVETVAKKVSDVTSFSTVVLGGSAIVCEVASGGACTPLVVLTLMSGGAGVASDGALSAAGKQSGTQFAMDVIGQGLSVAGVSSVLGDGGVVVNMTAEAAGAFSALLGHFERDLSQQ